jgi:hypothetical protein
MKACDLAPSAPEPFRCTTTVAGRRDVARRRAVQRGTTTKTRAQLPAAILNGARTGTRMYLPRREMNADPTRRQLRPAATGQETVATATRPPHPIVSRPARMWIRGAWRLRRPWESPPPEPGSPEPAPGSPEPGAP